MRVSGYSGTAGDALIDSTDMQFSTSDNDNDIALSNCAEIYPGGWWFHSCLRSNLNGLNTDDGIAKYAFKGIVWYSSEWSTNSRRSLKTTTMAIFPVTGKKIPSPIKILPLSCFTQ